jgi:hypothetical protein
MSNMSYCRFENTNSDLSDCEYALERLIDREEILSSYELEAAQLLVKRCQSILGKLEELPRRYGLENDGDEINALEFDFDETINLLNADAEKAHEEEE